jgi:hypothetical protein
MAGLFFILRLMVVVESIKLKVDAVILEFSFYFSLSTGLVIMLLRL